MNVKQFTHKTKNVGTFDRKRNIVKKEVDRNIHLFRKLNAWGIDNNLLEGISFDTTILIHEKTDDQYYWLTKQEINEVATDYIGYVEHGLQKMVPLHLWHTLTEEQQEENHYRRIQGLSPRFIPGM